MAKATKVFTPIFLSLLLLIVGCAKKPPTLGSITPSSGISGGGTSVTIRIAPEGKKGLYMGYANVPQGIGWIVGSIYAGHVYERLGDKANLALDYLANNYSITDVPRTEAMTKLVEVMNSNHVEVTSILWNAYHPYKLWYQFAAIGIASAIGMFFYARWVKKSEAPDV